MDIKHSEISIQNNPTSDQLNKLAKDFIMSQLNNVQQELQSFMDYRWDHSHLDSPRQHSVKLTSHWSEIVSHFNNSKHWVKNSRGWSHKAYGLVVTHFPNQGYRLGTDY